VEGVVEHVGVEHAVVEHVAVDNEVNKITSSSSVSSGTSLAPERDGNDDLRIITPLKVINNLSIKENILIEHVSREQKEEYISKPAVRQVNIESLRHKIRPKNGKSKPVDAFF